MIWNNQPDLSDIALCVNDMNISLKAFVKPLGVFMNYELNFCDRITNLCKRASRQLTVTIWKTVALGKYFLPL